MPVIVGFAGKMGSGKTALSTRVARSLAWPRASFGDYVRHVATTRGLGISRAQLQEVGLSLIASGWPVFCSAFLSHTDWLPGQSLVVDGVRHSEVIDALKDATGASRFLLVYVQLSDGMRATRLADRNGTADGTRDTADSHSIESQVHSSLSQLADLVVDGSRPVDDLCSQITSWVSGMVCLHGGDV